MLTSKFLQGNQFLTFQSSLDFSKAQDRSDKQHITAEICVPAVNRRLAGRRFRIGLRL